jgi:hypothetical protein
MCLACKLFAVMTTLTLGICAFAPSSHAQRAKAGSQSAFEAPHALSKRDWADRLRIAEPKRQIERKSANAPAPASLEPLLFLSDEYLKSEKQTEDRLKRVMTICKGC